MNPKPNILIIEDNKNIWESLINHILKEEYEISWKENNFDSFDIKNYDIQKYDIIICDYFLSGKRGTEIIKKNIKSLDPDIPIIFWTSSLDPHIISETIVGDSVFFKKELDVALFKKVIDEKIALRRANKFFPLYNQYFNIRIRNEELRRLASIIYKNASRYLESFFAHSKYHSVFNAHGLIHIQRVINNLSNLLKYAEVYDNSLFAEDEYYALYVAALIHDLGMIPPSGVELNVKSFSQLRDNHCKKIFEMVVGKSIDTMLKSTSDEAIFLVPSEDNKNIRHKIALIVLHHACGFNFFEIIPEGFDIYFIEDTEKKELNNDKNLKLMSALLALAEKLDYGTTRVPIEPSRSNPIRSMTDEFEYLKNECVKGYEIIPKENVIRINIRGIKNVVMSNEQTKILFKKFTKEGFDDNGNLTDKGVLYAQNDVITNVYKYCWDKIKKVFNASNSNFLKNLELEYDVTEHNIKHQLSENSKDDKINQFLKLVKNLNYLEREFLKHSLKDFEFGEVKLIGEGKSKEKSFYLKDTKIKIKNNSIVCTDKFLKFGRLDEISKENENYKIFATKFLPPHLTIGQIEELKYLDVAGFLGNVITTGNESGINVKKFIEESKENKIRLISRFIKDSLKKFYNTNKANTDKKIVVEFYRNLFNERYEKDIKLRDGNRNIEKCYKNFKYILDKVSELKKDLHFSFIHGDFTFRNILYTGDNIVFIDFANSGWGHYFFDFAKLEHFILNEMLTKNERKKWDKKISKKIWDLINLKKDDNFNVQRLLAVLYMKLWCLKYDPYEITIEERIKDFNNSYSQIIEKLKIINKKKE